VTLTFDLLTSKWHRYLAVVRRRPITNAGFCFVVLLTEQSVCQSEYFRAKCSAVDEVLMVTSALYGRMHISKCVKENFGFIGCSTDVLDIVDGQCSGRRECSIRILDENFGNAKPCHDDLKTYLQVNYRCVKGELIIDQRPYTARCRNLLSI